MRQPTTSLKRLLKRGFDYTKEDIIVIDDDKKIGKRVNLSLKSMEKTGKK